MFPMEVSMTLTTELERMQRRIGLTGDVKWMNFYSRHFPLHYDKYVRTFTHPRAVKRVWFYGNRLSIK